MVFNGIVHYNHPHRIPYVCHKNGNFYHQQKPQMLAYIPYMDPMGYNHPAIGVPPLMEIHNDVIADHRQATCSTFVGPQSTSPCLKIRTGTARVRKSPWKTMVNIGEKPWLGNSSAIFRWSYFQPISMAFFVFAIWGIVRYCTIGFRDHWETRLSFTCIPRRNGFVGKGIPPKLHFY